jgi:hypothetical protein
MALIHINTQVNTTARILVKIPVGVQQTAVQIYNNTGATIYLGDSSITATGATIGNALTNAASVQIWLCAGDELYAICATSPSGYVSAIFSG